MRLLHSIIGEVQTGPAPRSPLPVPGSAAGPSRRACPSHHAGKVLAASIAVLLAACEFPTDRSAEVTVQLGAIPQLIVNDTVWLSARVMLGDDSVPDAEIRFSAEGESVLNVSPEGRLLAVAAGETTVRATAVSFAQAEVGVQDVKVRDVYELDSIGPHSVRFGETVQLYGVGLTQTIAATLGGADAIAESYVAEDPSQPNRFGVLSLWATPPAPNSSSALLLGFEGILQSDPITVIQRDLYEPNDSTPRALGAVATRLRNPALAFERVRRGEGQLPVDWYTFTTTGTDDWTISAWSPAGGARFRVYVTNSLFWSSTMLAGEGVGVYAVAPGGWGVGTNFRPCDGLGLYFPNEGGYAFTFEVPPDSAVIPLGGLPAGTYNVFVTYGEGGPFFDTTTKLSGLAVFVDSLNLAIPLRSGLEIRRGYHSILAPDQFEENDYCSVARDITVPGTLSGLTIDSPHDADWYRFTVGQDGQRVQFRLEAAEDFADLDTYVVRDLRPDSLVVVDFGVGADVTNETGGVPLEAGDYFLIVVDFLGVPTEYTLSSEILTAVPALDVEAARASLAGKRSAAQVRDLLLQPRVPRR